MKSLQLANGRRLAWREAGSGMPLLLLHGWAMSSAVFAEGLAWLAGEFRVLVPDLPGHGASEPGGSCSFADFAGDLDLWLNALGIREVAAVGWSLGGQVLLEMVSGPGSGRFRRLVLVGTSPCFARRQDWAAGLPDVQVRAMSRDLRRHYEKTMGDFFALQFAGENLPRERYRRIIEFAVRQGRLPEPDVALAALETLRTGDQRRQVPAVGCPTLVIHGELDRIVPPPAGNWLAEQLPAGQLIMLPQLGHAPFLSQPEEVFPLWRDFLHR